MGPHWYLFAGDVGNDALSVAAAALDGTEPPPILLARYGALPTPTHYDYINCTRADCSAANVLELSAPPCAAAAAGSARWYVAVASANYRKYDVIVWDSAGDACANNCTSAAHGA